MPIAHTFAGASLRRFGFQKTAIAAEVDAYFKNTVLLLPGDGTNGAQNNTFLDSSTNAFSITRNGNTTQGTFSPFSQTGWSNYFDGSGDWFTVADNAALDLGSGAFTIEFWVNPSRLGQAQTIVSNYNSVSSSYTVGITSGNVIRVNLSGDGVDITGSVTLAVGQWYHVAVSGASNSYKLFVNGTQDGSTYTGTPNGDGGTLYIGADPYLSGSEELQGYISNLRIVKGTSVYSSNFTPPTAALTAITNTSLLTCQSNRFVDNSTNAFTITRVGNTSVQAFSPFAPTAAYSAATNGGSGYFDGTGDYLQTPSSITLGSGDLTIEGWIYPTNTSGTVWYDFRGADSGSAGNNPVIQWSTITAGKFTVRIDGTNAITSSSTFAINSWHHVALVRSGTTVTLYVNGTSQGTYTTSTNFATDYVRIGAYGGDGSLPLTGYSSSLRAVVGTAVYTTTFTPPTAPLTAVTNTQLLLNFTNAGITDATAKNDLETVGNAQISTTQSKFGGGSMYFDGTGDRATMINTPLLRLSSSEAFTIEFWVYANALSSDQHLIHAYNQASPYEGWGVGFGSGGVANTTMAFWDGTTWRTIKTSFSTGTWYHIAITSQGSSSTGRFFVDGTQQGSAVTFASSIANSTTPISIGATPTGNDSNVYIDDLRITKGIARYTANFTAPTKAFALQ